MRIAASIVTSNRESIVGDAVASCAEWVDGFVVVDLGITDRTLEAIAREAKGKPVFKTPRIDTHGTTMGEWRNAGMRLATERGFDWCLTLDTDERMHARINVRAALEGLNAEVVFCRDAPDRYPKERIFKLPTRNWFSGHAHESIPNLGSMVNLPGLTFSELPKSPEHIQQNCRMIAEHKRRELEADPSHAGNWFYLGDALQLLGEHGEAESCFQKCANLSTWDAMGAWAYFRAAMCARIRKDIKAALEYCVRGLMHHPGYSELAWFAAVICMEAGQYQHAIYWARMAMINGKVKFDVPHTYHCLPHGVWAGPYEILRDAYRVLGDTKAAEEWEVLMREAEASRLEAVV